MAIDDEPLNVQVLIDGNNFFTRQLDLSTEAANVQTDSILVDDPQNIVNTATVNIATETDNENAPIEVVYIPTENNLVTLVAGGPENDLDIPVAINNPTAPENRQITYEIIQTGVAFAQDNPNEQSTVASCEGNPPYFEDDYVMNHYVCLNTHFTRKHAVAAGLPAHTHPTSVPYNYGAKGVIIKVWPGGNNAAPLSSDFRTTHEKLSRARLPENRIFKINVG